jgi:F0F1-type ATP synthase membrane subunit c/vacuolar-type H+-ATPase subunit K
LDAGDGCDVAALAAGVVVGCIGAAFAAGISCGAGAPGTCETGAPGAFDNDALAG